MSILVIPVQTVSDIITNSSSEVFILDTGKTCEEVDTILHTFTSGFSYPEVFSLKDFREWRKKLRNGVFEYLEEIIQKHDIKNAAFGAHFVEYLKTSKIKTHLYPPESLSKNVILTKDKVQITPSSFNLKPIRVINL